MVPAAGTRLQRETVIEETPADMARDILEKSNCQADEEQVEYLCEESLNPVHWLVADWDVNLHLVDDFKYPKHSESQIHAPEGRNGEILIAELVESVEETPNIKLLTNTPVMKLVADAYEVCGVIAGLTQHTIHRSGEAYSRY